MKKALLYFVKYPEPGKVKTRLAKSVGNEKAAQMYQLLAEENWRVILQVKGVDIIVVFDPAEKEQEIRAWLPACCHFWPQHKGDLGARMSGALQCAFDCGYDRVAVLGSDILALTLEVIEQGFAALDSYDLSIGPAKDGGYYFLALSRVAPSLFENIAWSTSGVLAVTKQRAQLLQLSVFELPEREDWDEGDVRREGLNV